VDDILSRIVHPPISKTLSREFEIADRRRTMKTDFLELELATAHLERQVRNLRFAMSGRGSCADDVSNLHDLSSTSRSLAERAKGMTSYRLKTSGEERLIEVKTTSYGDSTPFFVTRNELAVSSDHSDQYFVYRVFAFDEIRNFLSSAATSANRSLSRHLSSWRVFSEAKINLCS